MTTRWDWTGLAERTAADDLIRTLNTRMPRLSRAWDAVAKEFLPVINVYQYAQDGTVNATSIQDATDAAINAGGGIVFFPPGFYSFDTDVDLTGTVEVIYQGSGRNVTHLVLNTSGVHMFDLVNTVTRVQWNDLWIGALEAKADGYGFRSLNSSFDTSELIMNRVTLQNLPYPAYWEGIAQCSFNDVRQSQTIAGATVGNAWYMVNCNGGVTMNDYFAQATAGTYPGDILSFDSNCDSIFVHHAQIGNLGGGSSVGIHLKNTLGGGATGPRLMRITDSQVELAGSHGFYMEHGRDVRMSGCHAALNGGAGFRVTGGDSPRIENSFAALNDQHAFWVTGGDSGLLQGNTATDNGQDADNTYDGFFLDTVTGCRVVGNRSGDFIYNTGINQRYGLNIQATTDSLAVGFNDLRGNQTGALNNVSGGANNQVANNVVA